MTATRPEEVQGYMVVTVIPRMGGGKSHVAAYVVAATNEAAARKVIEDARGETVTDIFKLSSSIMSTFDLAPGRYVTWPVIQ